jgi:hypothetical protein
VAFRGAQPASRFSKDPFASKFVAERAAGGAAQAATRSNATRSPRGNDIDVAGSVFVVAGGRRALCGGKKAAEP